jgi:peptidoglycan/LPS O-acetylase OafA/YrhL
MRLGLMNTETGSRRVNYPMFDVLRLVLASAVVLIHVTGWAGMNNGKGFDFVLIPVPCFLALSGFMVLASREGSRNAAHFWQKRVLRILPAFIIALALVAVLFGVGDVLPTLRSWWTFGIASNGHDGPLWSLSCEEVLYAFMMILWALGAYRYKAFVWLALLVSVVGLLKMSLFPGLFARLFMLPPAFFLGNLFYLYRQSWTKYSSWFWVPLAAGLVAQYLQSHVYPAYQIRELATCVTCLMLGTLATGRSWLKADVSYGVYVYHAPILLALEPLIPSPHVLWVVGPLCILAFSILSFYLIEKPALKLKNWRPARALVAETPVVSPVPLET